MTQIVEDILALEHNTEIRLTIDGQEFSGVCNQPYYEPFEDSEGTPSKGALIIDVDLDGETFSACDDVPSSAITIRATEKRRGWSEPAATVWDPELDGGLVLQYHWVDLGTVEEVAEA